MTRQKLNPVNRQSGASLMEVLISIIVLAVGMLGAAHLQATGLMSNQRAYQRSQATFLAYDIADRMRANTASLNSYLTRTTALKDAKVQTLCQTTEGCASNKMAEHDLYEWKNALGALEGATGTIVQSGGLYTISVAWDDNVDGKTDGNDPTFQVSFQP